MFGQASLLYILYIEGMFFWRVSQFRDYFNSDCDLGSGLRNEWGGKFGLDIFY